MNYKAIFWGLIVGGLILILFGINAMDSFNSDVNRFFSGNPTYKSIWMLVVGLFAIIAGFMGVFSARRKS